MTPLQQAAAEMVRRGCYIFPLDHPDLPECAGSHRAEDCDGKRGKHPTCAYTAVASNANTAAEDLGDNRNYGIYTRKSALVVLDEDEVGKLKEFAQGREIPHTFIVITHDGRKHYYFKAPDWINIPNKDLCKGINVRAYSEGYVVGPGSKHECGEFYTPEDWDAPFAELPEWLLNSLINKEDDTGIVVQGEAPPEALYRQTMGAIKEAIGKAKSKPGQRSEGFYYLVGRCKALGWSQANAVYLLTGWCDKVGKFQGRVDKQVANVWNKFPEYVPSRPAELSITCAADIEDDEEPITWMWRDRIPAGELSLLAGNAMAGKSTYAVHIGSQVTRGTLDGDWYGRALPVLMFTAEDDYKKTLLPKFKQAGADTGLVHFVHGRKVINTDTGTEIITALCLPEDLATIEATIKSLRPGLIIIDPLTSFVSGTKSENANKEMRQALEPLVYLCQKYNVTALGIAHLNKNTSTSSSYRIIGSVGIYNLARAVLMAYVDPEDGTRYMGNVKNNLGPVLPATIYEVEDRSYWSKSGGEIRTVVVNTVGEDERTIDQIYIELGDRRHRNTGRPPEQVNAARLFIMGFIRDSGGSAERPAIEAAALEAGHTRSTITRALNGPQFEKAGRRAFGGPVRWQLTEAYRTRSEPMSLVGMQDLMAELLDDE